MNKSVKLLLILVFCHLIVFNIFAQGIQYIDTTSPLHTNTVVTTNAQLTVFGQFTNLNYWAINTNYYTEGDTWSTSAGKINANFNYLTNTIALLQSSNRILASNVNLYIGTSNAILALNGFGTNTTLTNAISISTTNFYADIFNHGTNVYGGKVSRLGNSVVMGANITDGIGADAVEEGTANLASGYNSHAAGGNTVASSDNAFSVGAQTIASGVNSFSEGGNTLANGTYSHAGGVYSIAGSVATFAYGDSSEANGYAAVALGAYGKATNDYSFVWNDGTTYGSLTNNSYSIHAANGIRLDGGPVTVNGLPISVGNGAGSIYPMIYITNSYPFVGTNAYLTNLYGIYTNTGHLYYLNQNGAVLGLPGISFDPVTVLDNGYVLATNVSNLGEEGSTGAIALNATLLGNWYFQDTNFVTVVTYQTGGFGITTNILVGSQTWYITNGLIMRIQ